MTTPLPDLYIVFLIGVCRVYNCYLYYWSKGDIIEFAAKYIRSSPFLLGILCWNFCLMNWLLFPHILFNLRSPSFKGLSVAYCYGFWKLYKRELELAISAGWKLPRNYSITLLVVLIGRGPAIERDLLSRWLLTLIFNLESSS